MREVKKSLPIENLPTDRAELSHMYEEILDKMISNIRSVLIKKNETYNFASFKSGRHSIIANMYRQLDKMNRFQFIIEKAVDEGFDNVEFDSPFGESLFDTTRDMAGYSLIGMMISYLMNLAPDIEHEDYSLNESVPNEKTDPDLDLHEGYYKLHQSYSAQSDGRRTVTVDQYNAESDLDSAIENLYLSYQDSPEDFSKALWLSVTRKLKKIDEKFLHEVAEILFLRDDVV